MFYYSLITVLLQIDLIFILLVFFIMETVFQIF